MQPLHANELRPKDPVRQHGCSPCLVQLEVEAFKLADVRQILADEVCQLLPLPFFSFPACAPIVSTVRHPPRQTLLPRRKAHTPVFAAALMLHAHPQLVHLREVQQQELQGVADVAALALKV